MINLLIYLLVFCHVHTAAESNIIPQIKPITSQDSTYYKEYMYISEISLKSLTKKLPFINDILKQGIDYYTKQNNKKVTKISLCVTETPTDRNYLISMYRYLETRVDEDGYCPAIDGNFNYFNFEGTTVFLYQLKGYVKHTIIGDFEDYKPQDVLKLPIEDKVMKVEISSPPLFFDFGFVSWNVNNDSISPMEITIY